MATDLKQPNRRTIQTSIASLAASGHLRKLTASSRSRVAYQLRVSTAEEWPQITFDAARQAKILPSQGVRICAAGDANAAQPSSLKFRRKNTQGNRPPPVRIYTDNTKDVFDDPEDLVKPCEGPALDAQVASHSTVGRKHRGEL